MRLGFLFLAAVCAWSASAETSALWGESGELWSPSGRLPDFSFAGYRRGEAPLPEPAVTCSVRDFGAVGDGVHDDSDAFLRAVAEAKEGAVLIPEGRYLISKIIRIERPNLAFRGVDRDKSVLYFPKPLQEVEPGWGETSSGRKRTAYSYNGGYFWLTGSVASEVLTAVEGTAARGAHDAMVANSSSLSVGQEVEVYQQDFEGDSLAEYVYTGDPRLSIAKMRGRTSVSLVARITAIDGKRITLDRPLRFEIRPEWEPVLRQYGRSVTECGIENLTFEFPVTPYPGHFNELGYNAIMSRNTAHCWVRNVRIRNADNGIIHRGDFWTIEGLLVESDRPKDADRQAQGHHGVTLAGDDNLLTGFDYRARFLHDITVVNSTGNVSSNGRGVDLSFDHHRRGPYGNLFTNIHVGRGESIWRGGGGADLGAHCAGWGTFWNIRADSPLEPPDADFGPWSINIVGIATEAPGATALDGRWFETIAPEALSPQNLHEAQVKRRFAER